MAASRNGTEKPEIYSLKPPEWLPKLSSVGDLGLQGFFPPRPGENEDVLTDSHVKHGYTYKSGIPGETYTPKAILIKAVKDESVIPDLEAFMNDVFRRRAESIPQLPERSFKIPSRITFNDARKQAWFADLANPDVPLYKLGKNIPHGVRGHDLLELLHSLQVSIPRAVWFIRVFGSNETAGLRNKPNYNPMQYSVDWALVMTGFIRKQLLEVGLPSAPKLGLNIKHTFKGVFSDAETRERWVARFSYTIQLLKVCYAEFMVDQATFLSWLVQQLVSCNLAQASFLARLAEDYHEDIVTRRSLAKPLVDSCLAKLVEIDGNPLRDGLSALRQCLCQLLQKTLISSPSTFVSASTWKSYSAILRAVLLEPNFRQELTQPRNSQEVDQVASAMRSIFRDVQLRNEALLFQGNYSIVRGALRQKVADVQLLNSITTTTEMSDVNFFGNDTNDFASKLHLLLSWSVCPVQYGFHRPYAAVTILRKWRDKEEERACRRDTDSPNDAIQDELFDWLDSNDLANDPENLRSVSLLYGELVEKGLFSYDRYIQRVIARGEPGLSFNEEPGSQHRMFLRVIPLHSAPPALVTQRKITLYGARARTIPEDQIENDMRGEIRSLLPEVFDGPALEKIPSRLPNNLVLCTAARYEQIRVVRQWFLPKFRGYLNKSPPQYTLFQTYVVLVEILEEMQCFRSVLQVSLDVLKRATTNELLEIIIDTLRRLMDIWASMDVLDEVTVALYNANRSRKAAGVHVRSLVKFIIEVDGGRFLDDLSRQNVIDEAVHYAQALSPATDIQDPVPPVLPEILLLAQDSSSDAPSTLARSLWFKYRTNRQWTWIVWDNVIASLRQLPALYPDPVARRACAHRYAIFLHNIEQHSANGIDEHVRDWFERSGMNELSVLNTDVWDVIIVVFLQIAILGSVNITTFLEGVVYPAWRLGAVINEVNQLQTYSTYLHSANTLCNLLLFNNGIGSDTDLSPADLLQMQRLRTRRKDVFLDEHFRMLVANLPHLVYFENSQTVDYALRSTAENLRISLCCCPELRLGALRYFDIVLKAFSESQDPALLHDMLHEPLVSTLRLIFNDVNGDVERSGTSFLSAWKLTATAAVTSFVLQLIGKRLKNESTKVQAEAELNHLVCRLLHNDISCDEVDFISEMARGVSEEVAGKFLNKGLERISEILHEDSELHEDRLLQYTTKAGYILKLLRTIMKPFRRPSFESPITSTEFPFQLDEAMQNLLMPNLLAHLSFCESKFQSISGDGNYQAVESLASSSSFLARLLQFILGFQGAWTTTMKEIGDQLLTCTFTIALHCGGGTILDDVMFTMFLDTSFYLFDEFPSDAKTTTVDLFQHCPDVVISDIAPYMGKPHRDQCSALLKYTTRRLPVEDLALTTKTDDGNSQPGIPLQMRPWEWIEHMGDPTEEPGEDEYRTNPRSFHFVRNNASLPLEWFNVQQTGERVRTARKPGEPSIDYFEDDFVSQTMFERDWREARVVGLLRERNTHNSEEEDEKEVRSRLEPERRPTPLSHSGRGASPALSAIRGGAGSLSSNASTTRRTQSPAISAGSARDAMDVDPPTASLSSTAMKRKASVIDLTGGDDAVAEGSSSAKRGKGVARKTTAGKGRTKK